jgi:uncharacterized tellurite resistance protein B-like protein
VNLINRASTTEHDEVVASIRRLEQEVSELRDQVAILNADLDESRRLNLRAAELLDLAYASFDRG